MSIAICNYVCWAFVLDVDGFILCFNKNAIVMVAWCRWRHRKKKQRSHCECKPFTHSLDQTVHSFKKKTLYDHLSSETSRTFRIHLISICFCNCLVLFAFFFLFILYFFLRNMTNINKYSFQKKKTDLAHVEMTRTI